MNVSDQASLQKADAELLESSFPDIRCLRCGFDDFYQIPSPGDQSEMALVTIACQRCGHVEQHLKTLLGKTAHPVPIETAK